MGWGGKGTVEEVAEAEKHHSWCSRAGGEMQRELRVCLVVERWCFVGLRN